MRTWLGLLLFSFGFLCLTPAALAQADLQRQLKDQDVADHWIYDDIARGFAEAKASGKSLLVLFR